MEFIMAEKPLKKLDYIVFAFFAVVCFFTFQQGDIMHTAGCSYGYLQGHFWDFYEWDAYQYNMWASYMPSTYLVFAIWNIPVRLLGLVTCPERFAYNFGVLMWYKLLPVSLYLISGFLIFKIASVIGMGTKKSKLCAYVFLTTPIGFFSQFMFGQYDIFTVFLILLGIYYYLKDNRKLFVLFFALSLPFKYYSLLIFVPMLLLKEKNFFRILRDMVCVTLCYVLEFAFYFHSPLFRQYVLGFGPTGYVYQAGIDTGAAHLSLVMMLFCLICAWAYFTNPKTKSELSQWLFYFGCLVIAVIFGLSQWHPQWLLFAVPFWVMSSFLNRDTKIFMALDIFMMLMFIIYTINIWPDHVDQELFAWGIFGDFIYKYIGTKLTMREIFRVTDMNMVGSLFTTLMIVVALFKHPKYCTGNVSSGVDSSIGWIRARFLGGVSIFLVPAIICFVVAAMPPYVSLNTGASYQVEVPLIASRMSQVFVADQAVVERIDFRTATYARKNEVQIEVNLVEYESNNLIYTTTLSAAEFEDNGWVRLETGKIPVQPGMAYRIDFNCYEGDGDNCISLYRTEDKGRTEGAFAIVREVPQDYNLCVRVFGAKE